MAGRPDWWSWELELSPHLLKRMIDRQFTEADVQLMLEDAVGRQENHEEGRWVIDTKRRDQRWQVIVEPIHREEVLLVITVYPID